MEEFVAFNVNGKTLRGIIHIPEQICSHGDNKFPAIVLCHGFIGNKIGLHGIYVKAARFFSQAGFVVLRFDFSGGGDSDGTYDEITINGQINETLAALEVVRNHPKVNPLEINLIGLSMGGAVAALTAEQTPKLASLAIWAPVAKMYDDIKGIVGDTLFNEIWQKGIADYQGYPLGRNFLESLQINHPLEAIKGVNKEVLVIHGTGDQEITPSNAILYQEARLSLPYSTEVHFIDKADHTFSGLGWEQEVFEITLKWLLETADYQQTA